LGVKNAPAAVAYVRNFYENWFGDDFTEEKLEDILKQLNIASNANLAAGITLVGDQGSCFKENYGSDLHQAKILVKLKQTSAFFPSSYLDNNTELSATELTNSLNLQANPRGCESV